MKPNEMTNEQLNAMLAKAMGECVHDWSMQSLGDDRWWGCSKCKTKNFLSSFKPDSYSPYSTDIVQAYRVLEWAEGEGWYIYDADANQDEVHFALGKLSGDTLEIKRGMVSRANHTLDQATARAIAESVVQIVMEERG